MGTCNCHRTITPSEVEKKLVNFANKFKKAFLKHQRGSYIQNRTKWSKLEQNGPNLNKMVQTWTKWFKLVQISLNMEYHRLGQFIGSGWTHILDLREPRPEKVNFGFSLNFKIKLCPDCVRSTSFQHGSKHFAHFPFRNGQSVQDQQIILTGGAVPNFNL